MSNWVVKAMVKRALACFPWGQSWNHLIQKHVTRSTELTRWDFEYRLGLCTRHLACYRERAGIPKQHFTVLELGTGYVPVIPVGLYLCGAERVHSIDKVPLLDTRTTRQLLLYVVEYAESGLLTRFLPAARPERLDVLRRVAADTRLCARQMLGLIGVQVLVGDARRMSLEDRSIDFIFSNVVLQDIPEGVLSDIFREFRRVLAPGGVMSHYFALDDRYSDSDRSISVYNFPKYPDSVWWLWNSSLLYQNRLRIVDYRRIHAEAGFEIIIEDNTRGPAEELESIPLAKQFQKYSFDDLAIIRSWMVAVAAEKMVARRDAACQAY